MALDGLRWAFDGRGLDHIRIKRALYKPVHASRFFRDAMRLVIENCDEFVTDDLAFGFRISDACEFGEEACAGIDGHQIESELFAKVFLDLEELVLAQNSVVDEDAGQLVANRTMDENSGD